MQFGLFNLMSYRNHPDGIPGVIADMRSMVRLAEDIGFDTAWFAEHHFTNYSISASPLMFAAHMAPVTRRIRLGSAVVVLPLYHPLRVAQEIALVDQMSEGRLVLGVGTGYQPFEFDRFGTPVDRRTDTFLRSWDLLEQAMTGGAVSAPGLAETPMLLRPRQRPMPPLFMASSDPRILARLGPLGATPFITAGWKGSDALIAMARNMRLAWTKAGLDTVPMPIAVQQYIHVTDGAEDALVAADCARFVGRMATALRDPAVARDGAMILAPDLPDEPPLETFRDNVLIGPPLHVAERMIAEIAEIGPNHYNCFFQFGDMPIALARRSLERFGAEVLPIVSRWLAERDAQPVAATA